MKQIEVSSTKNRILSNDWIHVEKNEIFLLLSFFFIGAAFANYEPYAPFWLQELFKEESFFIIGLVFAIPSIAVAVGTALWGYFADKFGIKKIVILGLFAYAILFLSLIFTTSATYFLIAILIGSFIGAAQSSNFYALGAKVVNKPKTMVFAKMMVVVSLSWIIMSPVVGWINDSYPEEERITVMKIQLMIAVIFCAISLIFCYFIKEKHVKLEKSPIIFQQKSNLLTYFSLIFVIIIAAAFFWQTTGGFYAYSSIYFLDILELKYSYYSLYLILKTALAVPLSILLGRVKKHNINILLVLVFAIWSFISFFFMMMFPLNWIMILIIYSIPMYPLFNITFYSILSNYTLEERRATAFGIMNAIGTSGYVVGILVLGLVADYFIKGIFAMLIAAFIFATVALFTASLFYLFTKLKKENKNYSEIL